MKSRLYTYRPLGTVALSLLSACTLFGQSSASAPATRPGNHSSHRTDAQVKQIERLGGVVTRDINHPDHPITAVFWGTRKGATDETVASLAGIETIKTLNLSGSRVTDVGLNRLAGKLPGLEELDLSSSEITDAAANALLQFPQLKRLHLSGEGKLSDKTLATVGKIRLLDALHIFHMVIGADAAKNFAELPDLRILDISCSTVEDKAFEAICQVKLSSLAFISSKVSDKAFPNISKCTSLRELAVQGRILNAADLAALAALKQLQALSFDRVRDEKDLFLLEPLKELKSLAIGDATDLTDRAVPALAKLKSLEDLFMLNASITPEGINQLKRQLPRLKKLRNDFHIFHPDR